MYLLLIRELQQKREANPDPYPDPTPIIGFKSVQSLVGRRKREANPDPYPDPTPIDP